ncbi:hypothetical protein [Rhizobium sp. C4]|uniref:hypothetical protein n=1 Tax=Rhizobium sp. C4 TaxID=1349800 RepID=UPI001E478256|nr:hypothetical protein [Rhizobium sp. C4]MCD2175463.1 hypothetical protein [Rhizobium sp. C4]
MRRLGLAALGIVTALSPALAPVSAYAAACAQEKAIYRDRDNAYELAFTPVNLDTESNTHRFKLTALGSKVSMEGYVTGSTPVDRSNGIIFFNCPDGDVTDSDIMKCTVWQGFLYGQSAGRIDILPQQDKDAADKILIAGLGLAIDQFEGLGKDKPKLAPWDVLDFKECAK